MGAHVTHTVQQETAMEEASNSQLAMLRSLSWLSGWEVCVPIVIEVMGLIPQWKYHQIALIKRHV